MKIHKNWKILKLWPLWPWKWPLNLSGLKNDQMDFILDLIFEINVFHWLKCTQILNYTIVYTYIFKIFKIHPLRPLTNPPFQIGFNKVHGNIFYSNISIQILMIFSLNSLCNFQRRKFNNIYLATKYFSLWLSKCCLWLLIAVATHKSQLVLWLSIQFAAFNSVF